MTSRELCRRAIEFDKPDRLPLIFPTFGHTDMFAVKYTSPKSFTPSVEGEDEWGSVWVKTEIDNLGQVKGHPLAKWESLENYAFPDPDDDSRYQLLEATISAQPDQYIACLADTIFTLWERYYALRGFDQALMDFYLYPEQMHDLLDRILEFHIGIMNNLGRRFDKRVDGFLLSDDWGVQRNTLISVPLWREFFKERYRRLAKAIHDNGMHAILHSDGKINALMPDMIELGFDGFFLHSPTVVGIEETGRAFAGKTAFMACIDIQNTYVQGTPEDVRREAKMLLEYWGTKEGGIIPTEYEAAHVGAPQENVRAAYEAFVEFGLDSCGAAY